MERERAFGVGESLEPVGVAVGVGSEEVVVRVVVGVGRGEDEGEEVVVSGSSSRMGWKTLDRGLWLGWVCLGSEEAEILLDGLRVDVELVRKREVRTSALGYTLNQIKATQQGLPTQREDQTKGSAAGSSDSEGCAEGP
jgi:hypothetical protein